MQRYITHVELRPDIKRLALTQGLLRDDDGHLNLKIQPRLSRYINSPNIRIARGGSGVAIDVTIINNLEHDNSTEVEFAWHYSSLPELLRRFSYAGGYGTATFWKADQGWSLREISAQYDLTSHIELDEAELESIRKDIAAEKNRIAILNQLEQHCRRESVSTSSKKLTNAQSPPRSAMKTGHDTNLIEITDNYLVLHKVVPRVPRGISIRYNRTKFTEKQWFGDVAEFVHQRSDMNKKYSTGAIGKSDRYIARGNGKFAWGAEFFVFDEQTQEQAQELLNRLNTAVRAWNKRCGSIPKKKRR